MMVGVFDHVFETGPVFHAEAQHKRHLNEYTSLDFEMGFIDSFADISWQWKPAYSTQWSC